MSGFCGWFGRGQLDDPRGVLDRMTHALPDHGILQTSASCGPNFGLALRSHPATGSYAADPDVVAVIEGYPNWSDPALSEIAKTGGHAKALIAAYKGKKIALFDALHGAFSFAVIDLSTQKAVCAIDQFGIQTLCHAQPSSELTVFGSTTNSVRAHPKVGSTVAIQAIYDYLYFVDRVPAPETIYREQRKLAPAEYLFMEPGRAAVASYWQMPYRSDVPTDRAAAAEELRCRLRGAVKANLVAEDAAHVGAFLSGGLDSSSIVAVAASLLPQKLSTFTIGFSVEGFDEAYYADIAAKQFKTEHHTYYLQPEDLLDILVKAAKIYDEPFGNSSFIPAYHCARLAKEAGIEMMLAGDGGDELFAGNKRYVNDRIFDYYRALPSLLTNGLLEPTAGRLSFARNAGPFGKILRYIELAKKPVPERMTDNVFRVLPPESIFAADALAEIDTKAPQELIARIYDAPRDASKLQRMMNFDLRVTLADSDLRKVTRMCELAGVRTRFPFLQDELAEFSARLPEALLIERGELRKFYKDAMRGLLPEAIIKKQKQGFGLPYLAFMNSHQPLRTLVCDTLTTLKSRGYFRTDFLDGLIGHFRHGNLSQHVGVAWDLLVLGLWFESRP